MKRAVIILSALFFMMCCLLTEASCVMINYDVFDLGSGIWEYSYQVSDFIFDQDYGFTVYFDYGLYDSIDSVSHGNDWDILFYDPDLILGVEDPGVYDALALYDNAALSEPFVVQFNWLGIGNPGSQYFEIYDPSFTILEAGMTQGATPVPEPSTILLFICALPGMLIVKRKH